jgi:hypothetical protein
MEPALMCRVIRHTAVLREIRQHFCAPLNPLDVCKRPVQDDKCINCHTAQGNKVIHQLQYSLL